MTVTNIQRITRAEKSGSGHEPQVPGEKIESIRDRALKQHEDNPGISKTKVAESIGLSAAAYTQFLNGRYAGDNSAVARKVERYWSTFDRRRAAGGEFDHVETTVTRRIEGVILKAEATQKIALIDTDSGVGASACLRHYAETNGTVLLECYDSINNLWPLLMALLSVVVDKSCRLRPGDAMGTIVQSLRDTNRTLLIDEAHYLTNPKCVDQIRRISDLSGVGVVFCSNYSRYEGQAAGGGMMRLTGYTQFQRRVVAKLRIKAESITANDLRLVLGQTLEADLLENVLPALLAEAHSRGGIGRCVTLLQLARVVAGRRDLAAKHIYRAIEDDQSEEES